MDKLILRSIVSNIATATYEIARYLAKLLAPLGSSKQTISNTKDFITRLTRERIPKRFKMISLTAKSFFCNAPLEECIDIMLNKIYNEKKIETNIPRNIMKDLSYLCTKQVHFTYGRKIYIQIDGEAMGSLLGERIYDICRGSHR